VKEWFPENLRKAVWTKGTRERVSGWEGIYFVKKQ
jgi:hypothetical protein